MPSVAELRTTLDQVEELRQAVVALVEVNG